MMRPFVVILALLTSYVVATPYNDLVHTIMTRQTPVPAAISDCEITCNRSIGLIQYCGNNADPSCRCNTELFQSSANCTLCGFDLSHSGYTPQTISITYSDFENEATLCRDMGFSVNFTLQLPPLAQALLDEAHVQDSHLRKQQVTFLALQIAGGHFGLVIAIAFALFSRTAHRDPTFFNFCFTWIISSIFYSMLLYRGTRGNTVPIPVRNISPGTCVAQAALVNGAQVMTACSTMALVIQLWIGLRVAIYGSSSYGPSEARFDTVPPQFLVLPYVLLFSFAIPTAILGKFEKNMVYTGFALTQVFPVRFYCTIIHLDSFTRAIYAVTLGLLIVTAVFDVLIILLLYRHWKAFRKTPTENPVSLSTFVRVIIFTLYRIVVAMTYATVLDAPPTLTVQDFVVNLNWSFSPVASSGVPIWVDMLQAAIPLVAFLVLGLNADMIGTLIFWRRKADRVRGSGNSSTL